MGRRLVFLAMAVCLMVGSAAAQADLVLGIAVSAGDDQAAARWQPLGQYLGARLGEVVQVRLLNPRELRRQAETGQLHLVISPATQAVFMRERLHGSVLATLDNGQGVWQGGVLVARRGSPLHTGKDLAGKKVAMLAADADGDDSLLLAYYLFNQGLEAGKDVQVLALAGGSQALVAAVQDGSADAAFLHTGAMGSLAREGKVHLDDFVIVDRRVSDESPLARSTSLHPQWCVTSLPTVGSSQAYLAQNALLEFRLGAPSSQPGAILRFAQPASLDSAVLLLKQLSLEPYGAVALSR